MKAMVLDLIGKSKCLNNTDNGTFLQRIDGVIVVLQDPLAPGEHQDRYFLLTKIIHDRTGVIGSDIVHRQNSMFHVRYILSKKMKLYKKIVPNPMEKE